MNGRGKKENELDMGINSTKKVRSYGNVCLFTFVVLIVVGFCTTFLVLLTSTHISWEVRSSQHVYVHGLPFVPKSQLEKYLQYGSNNILRPVDDVELFYINTDGRYDGHLGSRHSKDPLLNKINSTASVFYSPTKEVLAVCLQNHTGGLFCESTTGLRKKRSNGYGDSDHQCLFSKACFLKYYNNRTNLLPSICEEGSRRDCTPQGKCKILRIEDTVYQSNIILSHHVPHPYALCHCPDDFGGHDCRQSITSSNTIIEQSFIPTAINHFAYLYTPLTTHTCLYGFVYDRTSGTCDYLHATVSKDADVIESILKPYGSERVEKGKHVVNWNATLLDCKDGYTGPFCNAKTFKKGALINESITSDSEFTRLQTIYDKNNDSSSKGADQPYVAPVVDVAWMHGDLEDADQMQTDIIGRLYHIVGVLDNGFINLPSSKSVVLFEMVPSESKDGEIAKEYFNMIDDDDAAVVYFSLDDVRVGMCKFGHTPSYISLTTATPNSTNSHSLGYLTSLNCYMPLWEYYRIGQSNKYNFTFQIFKENDVLFLSTLIPIRPYEQKGIKELYAAIPWGIALHADRSTQDIDDALVKIGQRYDKQRTRPDFHPAFSDLYFDTRIDSTLFDERLTVRTMATNSVDNLGYGKAKLYLDDLHADIFTVGGNDICHFPAI